jgi:hypothetical protein
VDARRGAEDRPAEIEAVADERGTAGEVLLRLGRQSGHKVELDELPTALESDGQCVADLAVVELLVDHGTETLGPRFRDECKSGLSDLEDVRHEFARQAPGPQR